MKGAAVADRDRRNDRDYRQSRDRGDPRQDQYRRDPREDQYRGDPRQDQYRRDYREDPYRRDPGQRGGGKPARKGSAVGTFFSTLLLVVAIVITPDSALPAVYLGIMVTGVMIVSVLAYTKNSIDEKWFYWAAEIAKAISSKPETASSDDEEGGNG